MCGVRVWIGERSAKIAATGVNVVCIPCIKRATNPGNRVTHVDLAAVFDKPLN